MKLKKWTNCFAYVYINQLIDTNGENYQGWTNAFYMYVPKEAWPPSLKYIHVHN